MVLRAVRRSGCCCGNRTGKAAAKKSASNLRENFLAFTNFYLHSFTIFTKNGCVHAPSHPLTIGQSDIQDEGITAGRHAIMKMRIETHLSHSY